MITLECNYSKKLGLPGYSSHQFSVSLKTELADVSQVQAESARLYKLLQQGVDTNIKEIGYLPGSGKPENGNGSGNGNGHRPATPVSDEPWSCSDKQRELILKIIDEHKLDKQGVGALALERFGKGVKQLNKLEASGLIEELIEKYPSPESPCNHPREMIATLNSPPVLGNTITDQQPTVSATRLNTWLGCRLRYYFKYVLRLKTPKTAALYVGATVHTVLKQWNRARWRKQVLTPEQLQQAFETAWVTDQKTERVKWEADEEPDEKKQGWALLQTYFDKTPIPPDERPEGVEVMVEADLSNHGLPKLIGVLDLVRAGARIVDYKTVGQTPNDKKAIHYNEVQLSAYSILYREATGKREASRELHQLVKLKAPKLIVTAQAPMTENQRTRLFKQLESYVEGVAREDFIPSPGIQCSYCSFFNQCRKWS